MACTSVKAERYFEPGFKYEPSKDKFIDDLNVFPRDNELIPDWLETIINS